jgi:phage-related protein
MFCCVKYLLYFNFDYIQDDNKLKNIHYNNSSSFRSSYNIQKIKQEKKLQYISLFNNVKVRSSKYNINLKL